MTQQNQGVSRKQERSSYDLVVIGSGGGTKLVRPVAELGLKVAIVEKASLGGTCLNMGCIPSKMLLHPAELLEEFAHAARFFIDAPPARIDSKALLKEVFDKIKKESSSIAPLYEQHPGIDFYHQHAEFVDPHTLLLSPSGEKIQADRIVLATGARPFVPPIPGLEGTRHLTYKEFMSLKQVPASVAVLGTGFIGMELGFFLSQMGCDVTFLGRSALLGREDHQIQEAFTRVFSKGRKVLLGAKIEQVDYKSGRGFSLDYVRDAICDTVLAQKGYPQEMIPPKQPQTLEVEQLLVATGITPNTDTLGLERVGIARDARGFICVNDRLQTELEHVYALGDCIGRYFFRHSANFEGEWLFQHLYGKEPSKRPSRLLYPAMPHAVFTSPQIASVGPTEQECRAEGRDVVIGLNYYRDSAMGMALKSEEDFVKLIFCAKTQKLLGGHILGYDASNLLHMILAFMEKGGTCQDLTSMIYVHPALSEVIRNAARKAAAQFQAKNAS